MIREERTADIARGIGVIIAIEQGGKMKRLKLASLQTAR